MSSSLRLLVSLLLLVIAASSSSSSTLSRGWGDLAWVPLKEGLIEASTTKKPVMLIIWKTWCGACKALRPLFAASNDIAVESTNFIVVNAVDDEEPNGDIYSPDGGYIPRILFVSPEGKVLTDAFAQNHGAGEKYHYFYSEPKSILATMRTVASRNAAALLADTEPPASVIDTDL